MENKKQTEQFTRENHSSINRVEGKLRKHIMFRHFNNTIDAVEDKKATHGKVRTQFFCLVHSKGYF